VTSGLASRGLRASPNSPFSGIGYNSSPVFWTLMKKEQDKPESKRALLWSCALSLLLLALFGWMQASKSPVLDLKPQWLWIAVLPILIFLITGKYIGKVKGPGFEYEQFKADPQMGMLLYAPPAPEGPPISSEPRRSTEKELSVELPHASWTAARTSEYSRTDRLFLVHVFEPSTRPNQKYDITVFLIRHIPGRDKPNQRDGFSEVEKLELYFGPSWNDAIFTAPNNGGLIGVRTSAWGSFLAVGRVTFKDGRPPLILQRYIDFEMAPKKV
jgi:hypothetical protein